MPRQPSSKKKTRKRRSHRTVREVKPGVTVRVDDRVGAFSHRTDLNFSKASPEDSEAWFLSMSAPNYDPSPRAFVKECTAYAQKILVKAGLPKNPRPLSGMNYFWKNKNYFDVLSKRTRLEESGYLWRGSVASYLAEFRKLNYFDNLLVCVRVIEGANCFLNESNPLDARIRSAMDVAVENERLTIFYNVGAINAANKQGRKNCYVMDWLADKLIKHTNKNTARGHWESIPHKDENPKGREENVSGTPWCFYRDEAGKDEVLRAESCLEGAFGDELELQEITFKTWQKKLTEAKKRLTDAS